MKTKLNSHLRNLRQISYTKVLIIGATIILSFIALQSTITIVSADCDKDATCKGRDGNKPFCDKSGKGNCVECLNNKDCKVNGSCQKGKCSYNITFTDPPPSTGTANTASASATTTTGNVCTADNADVLLVIDTSNSMAGGNLAAAKKAAVDLVTIVGKNPKMRVGVATFDEKGRLNKGLDSDESAVISAINGLTTGGKFGTCLQCALVNEKGNSDVKNAFINAGDNGNKRHVILLTDGKINRWQKPDGEIEGSQSNADEKKARDRALAAVASISQNQKAAFWVVQYGAQDNLSWLQNDIVKNNNGSGKYYFAPNLANVDEIYKTIANEMLGGTVTVYVYDDLNKNGKPDENEPPLANVEVTLKDSTGDKKAKTNAEGKAVFTQLCTTAYKITVTPPDKYTASPPDSNVKDITVPPGKETTENFGFTTDNEITFNFQFVLHGLGIAGDQVVLRPAPCQNRTGSASNSATTNSSSVVCLSNQKPVHPKRDISIELLNASGSAVATMSSTMDYDNQAGFFKGVGKIATGAAQGTYTFRAKTPMFLKKKIAFTQLVKPGETYTLPPTDLIAADVDNDNQLSVLDYSQIALCYTYPTQANPTCNKQDSDKVDTDDNGVINEFDVNLFVRELSERIGE